MVSSMRYALALIVLTAAASPAVAQHPQQQIEDLRAQQEAMQRRAIDQANQLTALETRLRAEQGAVDLQRVTPRAPEIRYKGAAGGGFVQALPPTYPAIPDAALAASNKRVQDAARERR